MANNIISSEAPIQNSGEENSGQLQNQTNLRQLEIEAYSSIISALYAQGELSWRKDQLLQELRWALKIPDDLHKRELLRVYSDNSLSRIHQKLANSMTGPAELLYNNFELKTDKIKPPPRKKRKMTSPTRGLEYDQFEEKGTKRGAQRKVAGRANANDKLKKKGDEPTPLDTESEEELKAKKARMEQEKAEIIQKLASLTNQSSLHIEESDDEEMTAEQPTDPPQFTFATTEKIDV